MAYHVKEWSARLIVSHDLAAILREWPTIQGFDHDFEVYLFADLIKMELASYWGSLVKLCIESSEASDRFKLMFLFATIAFDANVNMDVLRSLIAMAVLVEFRSIQLPRSLVFNHFRGTQVPTIDLLLQLMNPFRAPYPRDERSLLSIAMHPKQRRKLEMAQLKHEEQSEDSCKVLATELLSQWPSRRLSGIGSDSLPLLNFEKAVLTIEPEWERLFDNYQLAQYLDRVQKILNNCKADDSLPALSDSKSEQEFYSAPTPTFPRTTLKDLLCQPVVQGGLAGTVFDLCLKTCTDALAIGREHRARPITEAPLQLSMPSPTPTSGHPTSKNMMSTLLSELKVIVAPFATSDDSIRRAYGKDLQKSIYALEQSQMLSSSAPLQDQQQLDPRDLVENISSSRAVVQNNFTAIHDVLIHQDQWLHLGGLLPDVTAVTLLEALPTFKSGCPSFNVVIDYAQSITKLQRLLRIQAAHLQRDMVQIASEMRQDGFASWQAKDHLDWLLLQIDFNLLIRQDQYEVAQAMIKPGSGTNSVLQMNMGQGKSSVIIPMIVADLANGKNLVRVVVPRPLLLQTAQLLQSRLGGLVGRSVKHIPFSRKSSTDMSSLKAYHSEHLQTLNDRGVLLTLPEHLLSFQLSGLQELSNGRIQQAHSMMKLQDWFGRKCRDILDESDHMLAVKTQLIYPSGSQAMVDGHPSRWTLTQDLLKLVKGHVGYLRHQFPRGVEVIERGAGTFPTIYLLDQAAKDALLCRVTDSVIKEEGNILPIDECLQEDLRSISQFLREAAFPKATATRIAATFQDKIDVRQRLLLLRGLLVHRILLMGLSKRWNVQYGIDPRRDPIAVPFMSKGIPSDQAEFGHPDVSILLTCLSFYYAGLAFSQFQQALTQLLKCDEPVREFGSWIQSVRSFPDSLRSWSSINVEDEAQCTLLWNILSRQMTVINFFLDHFVFPRHARTFARKLTSSGWDIATRISHSVNTAPRSMKENIHPDNATSKSSLGGPASLTVGFSGTNDNKTLLPMNILQDDLPGLSHTNAEVLTYLLQPRNKGYFSAVDFQGKRLTEKSFLEKLQSHGIRMLLDAGAQIIELDNISLVRIWLLVDHEAEAAVFFGEDGRARVLYRDNKQQPLAGSPYLDNLGSCLVYLDEAHTRGVDLKMPANTVAALTLGIMQTKDHTVQAAMRLRQLATSQSVVFFAPPEVHQSILNVRGKTHGDSIDSHDVIIWLLEQTCCNLEQLQPLYISQGLEYCRRRISAQRNPDATSSVEQRKAYLQVLEQPEQYSLERLYSPDQKIKARPIDATGFPNIAHFVSKLEAIKKELRNTGETVQALAHQEVEQEREVQVEVETVREVKKPSHAQALPQPPLQREIKSFVETGRLVAGSQAYQQAFVTLRQTVLGRRLGISDDATTSRLFITQNFINTVVNQTGKPRDEYSRPVHWLLWSQATETALICSDYEANAVLPLIRRYLEASCTNLIAYAAPITRTMLDFDTLQFYTVPNLPDRWRAPAWLVRDLGIFAGRLYFNLQEQGRAVYEFLGLPPPLLALQCAPTELDSWHELPFDDPTEDHRKPEPFSPMPLLFMQEWLAIRRKGQDFSQTTMGELCRGRRLEAEQGGQFENVEETEGK